MFIKYVKTLLTNNFKIYVCQFSGTLYFISKKVSYS